LVTQRQRKAVCVGASLSVSSPHVIKGLSSHRTGASLTVGLLTHALVPKRRLRRLVAVCAEWECDEHSVGTVLAVPSAVGRAEDANIRLAVAVEVARRG